MVKLCPSLSPNTKKKALKTRTNIGPFRTSLYRGPLARMNFLVLLGWWKWVGKAQKESKLGASSELSTPLPGGVVLGCINMTSFMALAPP